MKFIANSTVLLKQLQALSGVISTNNTLPILDNFLFQLKGNHLTVTATDLETTMTTQMELEMADNDSSIAVPAKILIETLKTFTKNTPITFSVEIETLVITISAGDGNFKLSGYNAEEYPKTPEIDSSSSISINSSILQKAISKTIFATGYDDLRPVMTGVFFKMTPENAIFVATDAHKLVCYKRNDIVGEDGEILFILPKKPLNQLKNNLPTDNDIPVLVEYNTTNAIFTFDNIKLICRLIDGKYPNYQAVIPVDNPNKLIVEREPFLSTIKRVSIFASHSTFQVRLKVAGMELIISAEDIDYSNEAKERLSCQYQGEDMEIGFNSKFLIEMLSNLDTHSISLEMSTPNRAGIIRPVDDDNQNEDILMLVMPVMLNN